MGHQVCVPSAAPNDLRVLRAPVMDTAVLCALLAIASVAYIAQWLFDPVRTVSGISFATELTAPCVRSIGTFPLSAALLHLSSPIGVPSASFADREQCSLRAMSGYERAASTTRDDSTDLPSV